MADVEDATWKRFYEDTEKVASDFANVENKKFVV